MGRPDLTGGVSDTDCELARKRVVSSIIKDNSYVRFEVLTAVKMSVLFLWVVTPCGLIGRYQHFGETYYHNPEEQH
jgi:hypothetical protein